MQYSELHYILCYGGLMNDYYHCEEGWADSGVPGGKNCERDLQGGTGDWRPGL